MRRFRRPLTIILGWMAAVLLALGCSPRPPLAREAAAPLNGLSHAFHISPEPTLLVFHRAGGLTPPDRAYLIRKGIEAEEWQWNCGNPDESCALARADGAGGRSDRNPPDTSIASVPADPAGIPALRAGLEDAPTGLEVYVTGAAAMAYDAAIAWQGRRYLVLAGVALASGLATLCGGMGGRRALVVGVSAGSTAALTSALAALWSPPAPLALSTTLSGGLAAGWAVHLLTPRWFTLPKRPAPLVERGAPRPHLPSAAPAARPLSLLQRALIQAGEGALLQALIIAAGLSGLLFDLRSGLALGIGLAMAVGFSLSATPALIALLTCPYPPRPLPGEPPRQGLRLGLAVLLIGGLIGLRPGAHPLHSAPRAAESAAGYTLLRWQGAVLGQWLPLHLILQSAGAARSEAGLNALRGLATALEARPAIARVEGAAALRPALAEETPALDPAEQAVLLARLGARMDALAERLNARRASIDVAMQRLSLPTTWGEIGEQLARVRGDLGEARLKLARVPTEFPEIASRLNDVPALRTLPDTLNSAVVGLDRAASDLQELAGRDDRAANRAALEEALNDLEALAAEAAALRDELSAAEAVWAGAALGDATPPAPNPYLVSHDLIRLEIIPAGDPYAVDALDEAAALLPAARTILAGGPLGESELTLVGASAVAAERRARIVRGQLLPGLGAALVGVALFAWGALSQAGAALRLAVGAALSVAAGIGIISLTAAGRVDAGVLALVGAVLLAAMGGRLTAGPALPTVEVLALALPPLSLALTDVATWAAIGVSMSAGLLVGHFLIAPALAYRPWLHTRR